MLLPLAIGMVYLHLYPRIAPTLSKWSIHGSLLGVMAIVVGSAMADCLQQPLFLPVL